MKQQHWLTLAIIIGLVFVGSAALSSPAAWAAHDNGLSYQTVPSPTPIATQLPAPTNTPSSPATKAPRPQPTRTAESSQAAPTVTPNPILPTATAHAFLPVAGAASPSNALPLGVVGVLLLLVGIVLLRRSRKAESAQ